jgi:hypothetical protein
LGLACHLGNCGPDTSVEEPGEPAAWVWWPALRAMVERRCTECKKIEE